MLNANSLSSNWISTSSDFTSLRYLSVHCSLISAFSMNRDDRLKQWAKSATLLTVSLFFLHTVRQNWKPVTSCFSSDYFGSYWLRLVRSKELEKQAVIRIWHQNHVFFLLLLNCVWLSETAWINPCSFLGRVFFRSGFSTAFFLGLRERHWTSYCGLVHT